MEENGMFRELRRRGQALPEEEAERILREGTYGVLSVTDADGRTASPSIISMKTGASICTAERKATK